MSTPIVGGALFVKMFKAVPQCVLWRLHSSGRRSASMRLRLTQRQYVASIVSLICHSSPGSFWFFCRNAGPSPSRNSESNPANWQSGRRHPIIWIVQPLPRSKFRCVPPLRHRHSGVRRFRMQGVSYSMPEIKSLIKFSIRLFLLGLALAVIGFTLLWLIIVPSLPSVDSLRSVELQVPLRIYSADRQLITTVG